MWYGKERGEWKFVSLDVDEQKKLKEKSKILNVLEIDVFSNSTMDGVWKLMLNGSFEVWYFFKLNFVDFSKLKVRQIVQFF